MICAPAERRRQWQPTPVSLPGKSHGRRSLVGYSPMSRRVQHDWVTSLSLFTFMHWRRKWQPTPVFLPRESQGQGSLVGCCLRGCTESDTTEVTCSSTSSSRVCFSFPGGSVLKNLLVNARDGSSILGLEDPLERKLQSILFVYLSYRFLNKRESYV